MKITVFLLSFLSALAFCQDYVVDGEPKSAVRVVAYEDLQCPDCAVYRKMLDEQLLPKYKKDVAFEHREFPLPKHKWARPAAIAARYFESLDPVLGSTFRQYCFTNQREITPENYGEKFREFAKDHEIDATKLTRALQDPKFAKLVEDDYQEGIARGVARTPTVFVNGEPFIERFTFEQISKSIDAALAAMSKQK